MHMQDLQLCLQRERGQHQHEMSTLETAHREKLRSLTQRSPPVAKGEEGLVQSQEMGRGSSVADGNIHGSLLPVMEEVSLDEREEDSDKRRDVESEEVSSLRSELDASRKKYDQLRMEINKMIHHDWHASEEVEYNEEMEGLRVGITHLKECYRNSQSTIEGTCTYI